VVPQSAVAGQCTHRLTFLAEVFNDGFAVFVERVKTFLDGLMVIVYSPRRFCSMEQTFRHGFRTNVEVENYAAFRNL
jgi:hypothetical protein